MNYIEKMNIKEVGEGTVRDFYNAGYLKKITDLYKIKKHYAELIQLPNYDITSINKMIKEIDLKSRVPASTFMASIGIEGVGKEKFKKILSIYTIDDLIQFADENNPSKLVLIGGIADATAQKIIDGINENKSMIQKLLGKYVTIFYEKEKTAKFIAVFHKIRSITISDMIKEYGGEVQDNLTKKTSFLIVPNGFSNEHSNTSDKARNYGIPIVEIDNVPQYIKGNFNS